MKTHLVSNGTVSVHVTAPSFSPKNNDNKPDSSSCCTSYFTFKLSMLYEQVSGVATKPLIYLNGRLFRNNFNKSVSTSLSSCHSCL